MRTTATTLSALLLAAVLGAAVAAPTAQAAGGVASIPHLTITPDPAVHKVQDIWMQVPGADVTFEAPSALGRLVSGVTLGSDSCHETSTNQVWSCGDNPGGITQMRVSYDSSSVLVDATIDYTVKVGVTNNSPTSSGYGQRNYSSGIVTINPADIPTSDLKVTAFSRDTRFTDTAKFFATIANSGPDTAVAVLTFSGYGSTRLVPTGDTTCVAGSAYTCRYQLVSGESVQYLLELAGNPTNMTLTAKVTSANADPAPGNNSRKLTLGGAGPSPAASAGSGSGSTGSSSAATTPTVQPSASVTVSPAQEPALSDNSTVATPIETSPATEIAGAAQPTGSSAWIWVVAILAICAAGAVYAFRVRSRREAGHPRHG